MFLKKFFEEFEKKYNIKLNSFQKKVFLEIVKSNQKTYIYRMRNGKTLLAKMLNEYFRKGNKNE